MSPYRSDLAFIWLVVGSIAEKQILERNLNLIILELIHLWPSFRNKLLSRVITPSDCKGKIEKVNYQHLHILI